MIPLLGVPQIELHSPATKVVSDWGDNYPPYEQAIQDIKASEYGNISPQAHPDVPSDYPRQDIPDPGDGPISYWTFDPNPPPPPPPPPKPKNAMTIIMYQEKLSDKYIYHWRFNKVAENEDGVCGWTGRLIHRHRPYWETPLGDTTIDHPGWPGGTYPLILEDDECTYYCDNTNAGAISCGKSNGLIPCKEDPLKAGGAGATTDCQDDHTPTFGHVVVRCEW